MNSECGTQDCALADLPRDVPAIVVGLPSDGTPLAWHGFRVGATVSVEADAPFGGPRIVRIGRARLALGRALTRAILVRPADTARTTRATGVEG